MKEQYLGDGLYVSDDGYQFTLRAPRLEGDHFVALDSTTLDAFLRFVERERGVKITVTHLQPFGTTAVEAFDQGVPRGP